MGIFLELRNECLIRELKRELNTDVLLFGFDGFTYFGRLQAIDDCRIALLTPAITADSTDVEILSPGGDVRFVEFARIDLWQIVAKGTGIVEDPIAGGSCSSSSSSSSSRSSSNSNTNNNTNSNTNTNNNSNTNSGGNTGGGKGNKGGRTLTVDESTERQESHELIRFLCRMVGDCVAITTLGGFLFTGVLGNVEDELAILSVDDIFVPGTSSPISADDVRTVVVNLEAITSVSGNNSCPSSSSSSCSS